MSSAHTRLHDIDASPASSGDRETLFKPDRPRHIDRYISFFGDDADGSPSPRHEAATESGWGLPS